ncbi:patatin-like phospholipase family protein [Burkholderiaceae bacterium FT117]|uniref:patatin-like phospholipase family protein n=1 Tax=Zeimonas sediminis TaxID=2944268 RepID=UPI002343160F|nr:patatin-like phospholipase family protein [Zeimonas sediminis]MCM5571632.1 patatin-like phospholipase family protein [Zeimonas sediminis]
MTVNRKRVALVIGSGSVKCAAAIGIQKVLAREGIAVDMLVGCSAGSIYAALIAAGHTGDDAARMTSELWTKEITGKRNTMAMLRAIAPRMLGFRTEGFGLRDDALIMQRLKRAFGDARIEDLQVPLHVTATDFANGELVVLSKGSLVDAIRASVALPFAFTPWRIGDRLLVDGYLADPLPISVAMKNGADVIIALGFESPFQESVKSAGRFAFQLSAIMSNNLLKSRFAFHSLAHHSEVIAILPEFRERVRLFDTGKIGYVIDEGQRAAEEQLPYLRQLLGSTAAAGTAP